jgi:hypothetical protein
MIGIKKAELTVYTHWIREGYLLITVVLRIHEDARTLASMQKTSKSHEYALKKESWGQAQRGTCLSVLPYYSFVTWIQT